MALFFLLIFGLLMIALPLVYSSLATLGNAAFYKQILESKEFKQEVSQKISFGGRLRMVAQVDKNLYYSFRSYVKKEIEDNYMQELGKRWVNFIQGQTNQFNPIINIQPLKNVMYYRVMKRIKQKYALYPALLRKPIEKEVVRRFSLFPAQVNIFRKLKVSKSTEASINSSGQRFATVYNFRLLLLFIPFLLLGLILLMAKKRLLILDISCFIGLGTTATLLILSFLFKGFIVNLSYNSVSYVGIALSQVKPYLDMFWNDFFANLKGVSLVLLIPFLVVMVGQFFMKDKKSEG